MTSLCTPQLSTILLGAVASTLAGCGGTVVEQPSEDGVRITGPVEPNPEPNVAPPEETTPPENPKPVEWTDSCVPASSGWGVSMAAGLSPTVPVDYVGILDVYQEYNDEGEPSVIHVLSESAGTPCASALDRGSCRSEFGALTSPDRDLVLGYRFIVTDAEGARELTTAQEIASFLGTIDTFNEAALVLGLRGNWVDCSQLIKKGDSYVAQVRYSTCGGEDTINDLTVRPDGSIEEEVVARVPSNCVEGRLTEGVLLDPRDPHTADSLGAYLSGVCQLESAAVAAFVRLSAELRAHGAPAELIEGALTAATEEIEHAQVTYGLARKEGFTPRPVEYRVKATRTLPEIAKENAAEGCVRELFGAACAHLQAQQAADLEIRKAWQKIAEEETRHAAWSLELDRWLRGRLLQAEWAEVERVRRAAVAALGTSASTEPNSVLVEQAGVPTARQVNQLLDALQPLFA